MELWNQGCLPKWMPCPYNTFKIYNPMFPSKSLGSLLVIYKLTRLGKNSLESFLIHTQLSSKLQHILYMSDFQFSLTDPAALAVRLYVYRCWNALKMSGIGDNSLEPLRSDRKRKLSTCDTPGLGWVLSLLQRAFEFYNPLCLLLIAVPQRVWCDFCTLYVNIPGLNSKESPVTLKTSEVSELAVWPGCG